MEFREPGLESLDLSDPQCIEKLIIQDLCGRWPSRDRPVIAQETLRKLLKYADEEGLSYEQFNELLLLLDQERVSPAFFRFFFRSARIKPAQLLDGVVRFRGFAMLRFGNFRYAYRRLSRCATKKELLDDLDAYSADPEKLEGAFKNRPSKSVDTDAIGREQTWYVGEITGTKIVKEAEIALARLQETNDPAEKNHLTEFLDQLDTMGHECREIGAQALQNLYVYLTWDFLDVYVATSMRNRWEFEAPSISSRKCSIIALSATFNFGTSIPHRPSLAIQGTRGWSKASCSSARNARFTWRKRQTPWARIPSLLRRSRRAVL